MLEDTGMLCKTKWNKVVVMIVMQELLLQSTA